MCTISIRPFLPPRNTESDPRWGWFWVWDRDLILVNTWLTVWLTQRLPSWHQTAIFQDDIEQWNTFRIANSTSLLVSLLQFSQHFRIITRLRIRHCRIHNTNLVYVIEITCWTIWLDQLNAWWSLRYASCIYQTVFPRVILEAIYVLDKVWGRD